MKCSGRWMLGASTGAALIVGGLLWWNNRYPSVRVQDRPRPIDNGFDDIIQAGEMIQRDLQVFLCHLDPIGPGSLPDTSAPPPDDPDYPMTLAHPDDLSSADISAAAEAGAPVLARARLAFGKEVMQPPFWSHQVDMAVNMSHQRNVSRLFAIVARDMENRGEIEQAANTLLDGIELANRCDNGALMIGYLVDRSCEAICLSSLKGLMGRLSKECCRKVQERLVRIEREHVHPAEIIAEEGRTDVAMTLEALRLPMVSQYRNLAVDVMDIMDFNESAGEPGMLPLRHWLGFVRYVFTSKQRLVESVERGWKEAAEEACRPEPDFSRIRPPMFTDESPGEMIYLAHQRSQARLREISR